MDSPETEKTTSASISLTNTSTSISLGSPQVQDSPLFSYISNLSPIKPVKGLLVGQGFTALNSPPLVFSSPHVNSNCVTNFLKRAQHTHSPSALVSTNNAEVEKSADGSDDAEKCARQLCRRLVTGILESDNKISEQSPCRSSEFLDNFLADSDDVDSSNSMHAVSPHLKQSNDRLPESSQCALNAIVKEPEELLLSKEAKKGNQENAEFDCNPATGEKQQKDVDYPSSEFNDIESDFSNKFANDKQQNEDSCAQDTGAFPQNDFECTPQSEPLEIVNACEYSEENAGEVSNSLSEVRQNQRGMHRRCLQFEEVALTAIGNRSHSSNLTDNNIKSRLLSTNVTNESQKSSGMFSNPTSGKQNPVSLSQPVAALLPPCSKPLGIGLHLNSIVSAMPTGSSLVASMKLAEDYDSFQGVETVVKSSHLLSRNTCFENASHCGEDEMHENNTLIMAGSTTSELYCAMEPLNVPNNVGCQATPDGTEKFIDNLEEFNKLSPKKKRIKTDGDGFKGCNCKKTKCLKLYCDCFAAGVYCGDACACQGCFNRPENEETVHETRHQIESRNPLAFAPKIVPCLTEIPLKKVNGTQSTPSLARHKRGCNCKKSMCLKKYCECYQANVGCSSGCRCEECKNVYGRKEEYVATMHGSEGNLNENLEMIATMKDFSHAEIHGQHLTPVTPSFQYSDHGMDAQRPHHVSRRCLPSPDSDLISYANSTSSPKNLDNKDMLLEEKNDSQDLGYYAWQISYDNADMADPEHTSPRSNDIPSLNQLTPLQHHPSMTTMASSTTSKSKDRSNTFCGQPFSTGGSLRRLTPPITPLTWLGATKSFKLAGPQTVEDDTPEILKDNDKTPIRSVKVSSPNKKRVSPPHCHVLERGSNSMGSLKSGRKFILKAVPSFPPLTPCIDSKGGSGASRSECADNSGGGK